MRELKTQEISMVAGAASALAGQAQSCGNDMIGATGTGATLGGLIGGTIGWVGGPPGAAAGAFFGGVLGGSIAGAMTASSSPNCRGPVPFKQN